LDFAATLGTEIRATARGVIGEIADDTTLGLLVKVNHGYGYSTRYGHCLKVVVHKGDIVDKGQIIALVGNTGKSTGPHLHYEVLKNGTPVNPMDYISRVQ
jgi:murein DD-endopeptidase MepM/ murein hydrolase activator NlpD